MVTALKDILRSEGVQTITRLAQELSIDAYLVGGSVRDALLGREVKDLDFALSSACGEVARRFAGEMGAAFFWLDEPRQQARVVNNSGTMATCDFALLRGSSIEKDLLLRDFTINALARPLSGNAEDIIDATGGLRDLQRGIIRACKDDTFIDDPLRLLRAIRFAATLGYEIDGETLQTITDQSNLLERVAGERLRDELFQVLAAPRIHTWLAMLFDSGLLHGLLPLALLNDPLSAGVAGRGRIDERIGKARRVEEVVADLSRLFPEEQERFMGQLNREVEAGVTVLSLVKLAAFIDGNAFPGTLDYLAARLRLSNMTQRVLKFLTERSELPAAIPAFGNRRAMFRFFRDNEPAGPGIVLFALAEEKASPAICRSLASYFLNEYEAGAADLLLSGGEVMHLLEIPPGKPVGAALELLREAESRGIVTTRAEAEAYLSKNLLTKEEPIG
ncbi:CCA tRNA nucleotidyltransferase [Geotalea sp. SG265]|uniref:CCA tRNA nucleotidyltransferase n=1 Tax=Geotalea sp. SG265 TaxID=2922867 RepID=UPI001FAF0137|nr:CCA tRNA nucleotidyltransferase [Geotalea sp. SG265]